MASNPNVMGVVKPVENKKRKKRKQDKGKEDETEEDTRKQFGSADYGLLCDWLEVPENMESIVGTKGKTKVGAKFRTKKQAYESMATFINERQLKGSKLATIDGEGARNRYLLLEKKYKAAKPMVEGTGWGLTESDAANHIQSIDEKLEILCPCYKRLDAIFGADPNVNFPENNYSSVIPGTEDHMPWSEDFSTLLTGATDKQDLLNTVEEEEVYFGEDSTSLHDSPHTGESAPIPIGETIHSTPTATGEGTHSSPIATTETVPLTPVAATELLTPEDSSPAESPILSDATEPSTQSGAQNKGSASSSHKKQKGAKATGMAATLKMKKSNEKGIGIAASFATGLESISEAKVQSNVLKERGQDMVFRAMESDRTLRAETSQRQLEFQSNSAERQLEFQTNSAERQFQLEVEKLKIAEKRIVADEKKIAADSKRDLLQAQVSIVNSNSRLSAEEIAHLFQMLVNPEGPSSTPSST